MTAATAADHRREAAKHHATNLRLTLELHANAKERGDDDVAGLRAAVLRAAVGVIRYSDDQRDLELASASMRSAIYERELARVERLLAALERAEANGADNPATAAALELAEEAVQVERAAIEARPR